MREGGRKGERERERVIPYLVSREKLCSDRETLLHPGGHVELPSTMECLLAGMMHVGIIHLATQEGRLSTKAIGLFPLQM